MYMLDSNIISALMNEHPKASRRFDKELLHNICIPSIVWAEVRYGICKKGSIKLQKSAESLAKMIRIVPFNQQTADIYAQLRAAMEKQGKSLSPMDMLIAASAVANHCILVTNDQAFLQVETLPVEDWTV